MVYWALKIVLLRDRKMSEVGREAPWSDVANGDAINPIGQSAAFSASQCCGDYEMLGSIT